MDTRGFPGDGLRGKWWSFGGPCWLGSRVILCMGMCSVEQMRVLHIELH